MLSTLVMTCRPAPPVLLVLALMLAAAPVTTRATSAAPAGPAPAESPAVEAARAELAALAVRIEALKKEVAAGRAGRTELQPLLARAQELATQLERMQPPHAVPSPGPSAPDAQELRERADALRDRADRLDSALTKLDARIGEVRRRTRLEESLQSVGGAGEVLAESAPRRVLSSRAGGAKTASDSAQSAQPGTPTSLPTGGTTVGPATGTSPPPSAGTPTTPTPSVAASPTPDPAARALSMPPGRDLDPLLPGAGDSLQDLLRKRARAHDDAATLRAQADALQAEAIRAENVR